MPEKLTKANKLKHKKKHGFMHRNKTRTGKLVLKRRRARGRKRLNV